MNERLLLQEGLAAQLYKINNPHGPLWHVLDERLRRRWRNKANNAALTARVAELEAELAKPREVDLGGVQSDGPVINVASTKAAKKT